MTHQLRLANNPQVDGESGHNDGISLGQANFVAATVLWEPQRYTVPALSTCGNTVGARGLHPPLLFGVCLPFYISWGKCWWYSWGVAFHETAETGQNKMSECRGSAFASNVYLTVTVPVSILSHRSQKIEVNKGGWSLVSFMIKMTSASNLPG